MQRGVSMLKGYVSTSELRPCFEIQLFRATNSLLGFQEEERFAMRCIQGIVGSTSKSLKFMAT